LAELVGSTTADYGWFSPDDFRFLVQHLKALPGADQTVLVGGQSITAWALYYDIQVPQTQAPYLSQDADFLANKKAAEFLSRELGGKLRLAKMDDHTINVGTIVFTSPQTGESLLIDILNAVHGLNNEEIRALAVPIDVAGGTIHVLHPLLCLKSRICNLADLAEKRTPEGLAQAQVALQIVAHYLASLDDSGQLKKAYWRIAEIADLEQGLSVFIEHGIDPLSLVDPARIEHPQFATRSWPEAVEKIERRRGIRQAIAIKRAAKAKRS
jgi:hypothetical protein